MLITPNEVVAWFPDIALWRIGRALAQSGQPPGRKHCSAALDMSKCIAESSWLLQRLTSSGASSRAGRSDKGLRRTG